MKKKNNKEKGRTGRRASLFPGTGRRTSLLPIAGRMILRKAKLVEPKQNEPDAQKKNDDEILMSCKRFVCDFLAINWRFCQNLLLND